MSTNIFGRDTTEDQKYQDLYASVKRIVEKSAKEEAESKGIKDISGQQSLKGIQNTYQQMVTKKEA